MFLRAENHERVLLDHYLRAVEHFGSTAVRGLAAKPIIDILVAPGDWPLASADRQSLEDQGYEQVGAADEPAVERTLMDGNILCRRAGQ